MVTICSLLLQAEDCPFIHQKMELYLTALDMCKMYGLTRREASIHCTLFNLNLHTLRDPYQALNDANKAILADPEYGEVRKIRKFLIDFARATLLCICRDTIVELRFCNVSEIWKVMTMKNIIHWPLLTI